MAKFNFKYRGRKYFLNVKKCEDVFSRTFGLMFRKKSKPLLFVFKKPTKQQIHSFFCRPFLAIWFYNNKIIDEKLVKPWRLSIKPKEKFDRLLEIPFGKAIELGFIDDKRKV